MMCKHDELLVVQCDKNLGPAVIEKAEYIRRVYDEHISDTNTYKAVLRNDPLYYAKGIRRILRRWIKKHQKAVNKQDLRYIRKHLRDNEDPFPVMYLTMKVHKTPLTTRPIISCCGSLLHPLGLWVDKMLQPLARMQRSYFKSTFELQQELTSLDIPPGAFLFIADATSMYTNIKTTAALNEIRAFMSRNRVTLKDTPITALNDALRIVMRNNVFTFDEKLFLQKTGTAMGTPPAPPYATIFFGIHEEALLTTYSDNLFFYRRFIDDVFGIWIPDDNTSWTDFQNEMNSYHGLDWTFKRSTDQITFMDLDITLINNSLITDLYEKAINPYLYIPPHSAHPPGMLAGLIMGNMHRIHTLCSSTDKQIQHMRTFYTRLLGRGYKPGDIVPLFQKALHRMRPLRNETVQIDDRPSIQESIFFHLRYHPNDPPSPAIQDVFRTNVLSPDYCHHLNDVRNHSKIKIGLKRLVVAYSRAPNLGNLLTYRKLTTRPETSR